MMALNAGTGYQSPKFRPDELWGPVEAGGGLCKGVPSHMCCVKTDHRLTSLILLVNCVALGVLHVNRHIATEKRQKFPLANPEDPDKGTQKLHMSNKAIAPR